MYVHVHLYILEGILFCFKCIHVCTRVAILFNICHYRNLFTLQVHECHSELIEGYDLLLSAVFKDYMYICI